MSILNVARIGKFSSDRAVREYCEDIWKVSAVPVGSDRDLEPHNGQTFRTASRHMRSTQDGKRAESDRS
jgi:hypothetical protein